MRSAFDHLSVMDAYLKNSLMWPGYGSFHPTTFYTLAYQPVVFWGGSIEQPTGTVAFDS